jgi:hypothetical protein
MSTVIEHWECVRRDGCLTFTFDVFEPGFRPTGDLIKASVDPATGILDLTWASQHVARLPDVGPPLAWSLARAPHVDVRWTADGLLWGAELVD